MRETRSSGSAEGVVGNHDPYSDFESGWINLREKLFSHPMPGACKGERPSGYNLSGVRVKEFAFPWM